MYVALKSYDKICYNHEKRPVSISEIQTPTAKS